MHITFKQYTYMLLIFLDNVNTTKVNILITTTYAQTNKHSINIQYTQTDKHSHHNQMASTK